MITAVSKRFAMRCVKNLLIFIQPHAGKNLSMARTDAAKPDGSRVSG